MAVRQEYVEAVKDAFLEINARVGHVMPMRNFRFGIMRDMSRDEQKDFVDTLNDLIIQGYLTYENDRPGLDVLRLTDKGYNELYPEPDKVDIAKKIMAVFEQQHVGEDQIVMFHYFRFNFLPTLNPKEQDSFVDVCNKLIDAHWIEYQEESPECIRLLQSGANYLYKKTGNIECIINEQ